MINSYIITIEGDAYSEKMNKRLLDSIAMHDVELEPETFRATTPETLEEDWAASKHVADIKWNYPIYSVADCYDKAANIYKQAYNAVNIKKKMACAISHIRLWEKCYDLNKPIVILEHDAIFIRKFSFDYIEGANWGVVGLNDPRGATRKSNVFYQTIAGREPGVYPVPKVNGLFDKPLPQGLAGNSAYAMLPFAAAEMLRLCRKHGIWHNDAIMCRELCPWLKVSVPFYTKVNQGMSTTVL